MIMLTEPLLSPPSPGLDVGLSVSGGPVVAPLIGGEETAGGPLVALGMAPVVRLTDPGPAVVAVYEADGRSVRALPDGLVPITDVAKGTGTTVYGYGGAEMLPRSLAEEFTRPVEFVAPGVCGSRVPAEPVVEGVSIVAIEVRVWPMVRTITVVD